MAHEQTDTERETTGWVGWVFFAGMMMLLAGVFQAIAGLVALFSDAVVVTNSNGLVVLDMTQWGWVHLIVGVVLFLSSFSVFAGGGWGRFLGSLLAGLSAIANFAFLTVYPIWSLVIITIDVLVIYALLVHGREAGYRADEE